MAGMFLSRAEAAAKLGMTEAVLMREGDALGLDDFKDRSKTVYRSDQIEALLNVLPLSDLRLPPRPEQTNKRQGSVEQERAYLSEAEVMMILGITQSEIADLTKRQWLKCSSYFGTPLYLTKYVERRLDSSKNPRAHELFLEALTRPFPHGTPTSLDGSALDFSPKASPPMPSEGSVHNVVDLDLFDVPGAKPLTPDEPKSGGASNVLEHSPTMGDIEPRSKPYRLADEGPPEDPFIDLVLSEIQENKDDNKTSVRTPPATNSATTDKQLYAEWIRVRLTGDPFLSPRQRTVDILSRSTDPELASDRGAVLLTLAQQFDRIVSQTLRDNPRALSAAWETFRSMHLETNERSNTNQRGVWRRLFGSPSPDATTLSPENAAGRLRDTAHQKGAPASTLLQGFLAALILEALHSPPRSSSSY